MKFAHRLRETTTATNMATIALAGAALGGRSLIKAIAAGALAVGDTNVPFTIEDTSGNWEDGLYTITSPTVLTRTTLLDSSNDGAAVTSWSGTRTVFCTPPAAWLSKVLSSDDGVATTALTAASGASGSTKLLALDANNNIVTVLASQLPSGSSGGSTDTTAPNAVSAAVANASPTVVAITMSEALNATYVPAASAFTVSGHTVSSVAVSGSTINLTVSVAFVNGEAARTVAYTQPGSNQARDAAGNLLANFSGLAITNNVAAAAPAGVAYTYTQLFGQTIPSTINASSATLYGAYRQIVPSVSKTDYWNVKRTDNNADAPSVIGGWSTSATVPPAGASDNSVGVNGYRTLDYSGGNFTSDCILWAQNGTYYWWMKASDGDWSCRTPSGVVITGA